MYIYGNAFKQDINKKPSNMRQKVFAMLGLYCIFLKDVPFNGVLNCIYKSSVINVHEQGNKICIHVQVYRYNTYK